MFEPVVSKIVTSPFATLNFIDTYDFWPIQKRIEFTLKGASEFQEIYTELYKRSDSRNLSSKYFPFSTNSRWQVQLTCIDPPKLSVLILEDISPSAYSPITIGYVPKWLCAHLLRSKQFSSPCMGYITRIFAAPGVPQSYFKLRVTFPYDEYIIEDLSDVEMSSRFDRIAREL